MFLVALQTTVVAAEYSSVVQISGQRAQVCTCTLLFNEITYRKSGNFCHMKFSLEKFSC